MNGLAFAFFGLAVVSGILGMGWGIQMSASGDHSLSIAHAHLNLIGWVGFAIAGVFYHVVPTALGKLGWIHFAVALAGLVVIVPGIVFATTGQGDTLAKLGSVLTLLSMVVFLLVVIRSRVSMRNL
jgi:cbb3-type cytochrome oxidase subunit 1